MQKSNVPGKPQCLTQCSANDQSTIAAESMAGLKLVKKASSEDDSDNSHSVRDLSAAIAEAYAKVRGELYKTSSEEDEEEESDEEESDESDDSGKVSEAKKNFHCDLCHEYGHYYSSCPFLEELPEEVTELPIEYTIMCKSCHRDVDRCHHKNRGRYAQRKLCLNCSKSGHLIQQCPRENRFKRQKNNNA